MIPGMLDKIIEDVIDYGGFVFHVAIAVVLWIGVIIFCVSGSRPESTPEPKERNMV